MNEDKREREVTIFTDREDAVAFAQRMLSLKPGTVIGPDKDGDTLVFAGLTEQPVFGWQAKFLTVDEDPTTRYEGKPVIRFGSATASLSMTANLMKEGKTVKFGDITGTESQE